MLAREWTPRACSGGLRDSGVEATDERIPHPYPQRSISTQAAATNNSRSYNGHGARRRWYTEHPLPEGTYCPMKPPRPQGHLIAAPVPAFNPNYPPKDCCTDMPAALVRMLTPTPLHAWLGPCGGRQWHGSAHSVENVALSSVTGNWCQCVATALICTFVRTVRLTSTRIDVRVMIPARRCFVWDTGPSLNALLRTAADIPDQQLRCVRH